MSMQNKHHNQETIERIRISNVGKHSFKHTDEAIKKISEAGKRQKGRPSPFKGKTYQEIGRDPSPLIGRERTDEVKQKISQANLRRLGQQKPSDERDGTLCSRWRILVKKRDSYTCQHCGIQQKHLARLVGQVTTWLHAHHIKSWRQYSELRFDVTNGITLCWSCHLKAEKKQISVPDVMLLVKKQKIVWNKGKTLSSLYSDERAAQLRKKLSDAHLGQSAWNKGKSLSQEHRLALCKPKKTQVWNKGKTLIDLFGIEKAEEIRTKLRESHLNT